MAGRHSFAWVVALANSAVSQPDFLVEADRILGAARTEGVMLRLLGALAFHIHCPKFSYMQEMLGRSFSDIDFASYRQESSRINKLFTELGYQSDVRVRALFGSRLVFNQADGTGRHCDVFLDRLEFCHDVDFQGRLEVDFPTIPLAELLLEKMQIVKLERKDAIDTIMLLREHQVGGSDNDTINADHLARLTARDWGLWRTLTINLENVEKTSDALDKLSEEDRKDVNSKIATLRARIEDEPKTMNWKIRSQIGEKKKWYRDVDEFLRE